MLHETIKQRFTDAVDFVASNISLYAVNPSKDFSRSSKFSIDKLLPFLVSRGSSSSKLELLDFFGFHSDSPSASALVQQQAKLKPDALEALFHQFHSSVSSEETSSPYCFLAVDGSTFTYFSKPSFSPLLLRWSSSRQSSNLMRWKPFSISSIPQCRRKKRLPLIVSWL